MMQTLFGVNLPPRRKKRRIYLFTVKFVLVGTVPSKKNRQRARINRAKAILQYDKAVKQKKHLSRADFIKILKDIKPFIYHGNEYQEWRERIKKVITEQAAKWSKWKDGRLIFPIACCSISIYHYWKDDLIRDNSNKAETIHDILIETGIISGDNWQVMSPTESDADLYRDEVKENVTIICINVYDEIRKPKTIDTLK